MLQVFVRRNVLLPSHQRKQLLSHKLLQPHKPATDQLHLYFKHVWDKLSELLFPPFSCGQKVRISIAFEYPQPQVVVQNKVDTEELADSAVFEEILIHREVEVGHLLHYLRIQIFLDPILLFDPPLGKQELLEFFEIPVNEQFLIVLHGFRDCAVANMSLLCEIVEAKWVSALLDERFLVAIEDWWVCGCNLEVTTELHLPPIVEVGVLQILLDDHCC